MATEAKVNIDGGVLSIPDTGVELVIPPGALEEETLIQMRIIPDYFEDEQFISFGSNASLVVELLPSKLKLLKLTKLTLPHCLVLKKGKRWTATVYSSHHEEGTRPQWKEEKDTLSELRDKSCVIWLNNFSWKKIKVGDRIIKAKDIYLYVAKRRMSTNTTVYLDVGYCLKLKKALKNAVPSEEKILLHYVPLSFIKEGELPLSFIFKKTNPDTWDCDDKEQKITFNIFVRTKTTFCTFVLKTKNTIPDEDCTCIIKAGQGEDLLELFFSLQDPLTLSYQPLDSTKGAAVPSANQEYLEYVVPNHILQELSKKILNEWKDIGRKLKLEEGDLNNLTYDTREGQMEINYQMLLKWKQKHGSKATFRVLGEALKLSERTDLMEFVHAKALSYAEGTAV